ncbi:Methyltransferase domain-containing protein [Brevibacterium iodinum ATCC 49514]|uniref:Methyltransferase domain-containing protein n=1 Tax=Brevibacterium iodinum ATCC 49514 TaxID=1255616 RepID=A0A2H1KI82_9MICO|nr:class I SAM-dependent methyltransferase [Brevibacterium iodinum]SMX98912.1 Methyltransferase domain-containing protein [Brevibacterium iodinum ATCC 49514]SUW14462.1 Predicted O-methyltransferase [Brevibacterium iodinum]
MSKRTWMIVGAVVLCGAFAVAAVLEWRILAMALSGAICAVIAVIVITSASAIRSEGATQRRNQAQLRASLLERVDHLSEVLEAIQGDIDAGRGIAELRSSERRLEQALSNDIRELHSKFEVLTDSIGEVSTRLLTVEEPQRAGQPEIDRAQAAILEALALGFRRSAAWRDSDRNVLDRIAFGMEELRNGLHLDDSTLDSETTDPLERGNDGARVKDLLDSMASELTRAMYVETQQTEALLQLLPKITPRWLLPPLGRWALDARAMLHLAQIFEDKRPSRVLELGSGTSSVWMGYLAEKLGAQIVSVEHDEEFAERTEELLGLHGLNDVVTVKRAPLEPLRLGDVDYAWYATGALSDLEDVDLVLVDGPVGSTNRWARYPAVPMLWAALARDAVVVLDDSPRADEEDALDAWTAEYPLTRVQSGLSRLAVLRRSSEQVNRL